MSLAEWGSAPNRRRYAWSRVETPGQSSETRLAKSSVITGPLPGESAEAVLGGFVKGGVCNVCSGSRVISRSSSRGGDCCDHLLGSQPTPPHDRFFPSQDYLPTSGSIGNLIALPLQGSCRKRGTTVFLDLATLEPQADQFGYLSQVERITPKGAADEPLLLRTERERQAWHDERHEKDRQEPLSGASEGDDLALGRVEGQSAAQVSAVADLQSVISKFDWYLDRIVHFERPDTLTVDHDIERATTDLHSDRFMRQLESCRHLRSHCLLGFGVLQPVEATKMVSQPLIAALSFFPPTSTASNSPIVFSRPIASGKAT